MLEEIRISSMGVIDEATVEFGPGLNVVTGETGAGKTMVVTALLLLLGARGDSGLVRGSSGRARVEGRVRVQPGSRLAQRADESGAELDEDSLILARTVSAEGRSRATAGGAAVPVGTLAELAADLVAVHGQSDQQQLLQPARQRECLDRFAGADVLSLRDRYGKTYDRLRRIETELADITASSRERAQEADLLRFGLAEIEAADPTPGEDVVLGAEESRLAHGDALRLAAETARQLLSGSESASEGTDALGLVAQARKSLDSVRHHDPSAAALADQLAGAGYLLVDAAADISSYAEGLDTDPQRLARVQERRATLGALTRKYGDSIDEVLRWAQCGAARLLELDDDNRLDELAADRSDCEQQLRSLGGDLSVQRHSAAEDLSSRVTAELGGLAMPHATFSVTFTPASSPTRDGLETVEFQLASHAGADPRSLGKGASGGELSRVMLAIEVCLAGSNPVPTMIFDEVDAGVGGKAAVEIGRRLARLAKSVQVVVVTHLPQVAAFADQHYVVVKSDDGSITTSGVTALDDEGRRSELSRMLAGLANSDTALAHADELVALARQHRNG